MSSDEDHNYYSQARRRLPDYHIDAAPSSAASGTASDAVAASASALPTLPASYYRQSQQYSTPPKRPALDTTRAGHAANARPPDPYRGAADDANSPDPHEFYRQFRESFRRDGHSAAGASSGAGGASALSSGGPSANISASRPTMSSQPEPVQARASRIENRFASTPPSSKPHVPPIQTLRGRQSSLQALVAKFDQSPVDVPPLPKTTTSRSSSANPSPSSATLPPRSFVRRVSPEITTKPAAPSLRQNTSQYSTSARRSPGPSTAEKRKDSTGAYSGSATGAGSTANPKKPSYVPYGHGSQSMTELSPQVSEQPSRNLLFGEVASTIPSDLGFGIPSPRPRRGSESSVQLLDRSKREKSEEFSPSSPTAWYLGVAPSLEGIDLSKPVPPRPAGLHRRSHSEVEAADLLAQASSHSRTKAPPPLSPTEEQETPTSSPRTGSQGHYSRIPTKLRHPSGASNEQSSFATREAALPTPLNLKTPERPSRISLPRKSPHSPDSSRRSPQLPAFISEPPPVRSPPLRSSRPRLPVSQASTAASRARTAATTTSRNPPTDKHGKALPELGGVDLAARRERIQRAFTTKVKEREIETEKKRASLIMEARMQKSQKDGAPEHEYAAAPKSSATEQRVQQSHLREQIPTVRSEKERTLTINTGGPDGKRTIKISEEDSPTLGQAEFIGRGAFHDYSSDGESSSADTSGSEDTYFDQEPQESGAFSKRTGFEFRRPSSKPTASQDVSAGADMSDIESIQIMLQATPVNETNGTFDGYTSRDRYKAAVPTASASSATNAGRRSPPITSSTVQGPWSPNSNSTITTAPSRRESDANRGFLHSSGTHRDNNSGRTEASGQLAKEFNKSLPTTPPVPSSQKSTQSHDTARGQSGSTLQTPAISNLKRASASLNDPDDWANTSPSMLDWIHHQALDTPVEERTDRPFAPPKILTDVITHSDTGSPMLPDIPGLGGLGIEYKASTSPSGLGSISFQPSTASQEDWFRDNSDRQSLQATNSRTNLRSSSPLPKRLGLTTPNGETSTRQSSDDQLQRSQQSRQSQRTPETSSIDQTSIDKSSVSMTESSKSSVDPSEQKRLTRRLNILKELVDTESSFGQDMTVVVDIYKGTSNVILNSPEDVKILFGNAADVVQFSTAFLDSLKQACKSVYVLPKSKRWKSKRDSEATTDSAVTDDQASVSGFQEMNDDERDRMTTVGTAFDQHMTQMEKVYTEYLKNHDAANQKLDQLQKSDKVKIWLKECRAYAHDLTTAWDLDSLLVKPVQRILKYPLLLKELIEVTPENHPDFVALDTAAREMVGLSKRINEAKRRADLVEQVNSAKPPVGKEGKITKRKESEGRLALSKAFGRRTEKAKHQSVTPDTVQDRAYDTVANKFGSHFFQLQVVMRDVEMYVTDVQSWVSKLTDFVVAIEGYMDVGQTGYTEIDSKWRRFRQSMREMQLTALADHIAAVRKYVIDPMTTLLKLHDGPQRLMDKRKKRIGEYAKYKAIRDRGEKPDKKTTEQGEQFIAVNETLKDELPKLFSMTAKLVEACLQNFVQLQMQWLNVWKSKLRQAIDISQLPESFTIIVDQFTGDFRYTEAQVLSLGLCNGSLLADTANFMSFLSPDRSTMSSSTLNDDTSSRRPSYTTDESRSRTTSVTNYDASRARGTSMNSGPLPTYQPADYGRAADGSVLPLPYAAPLASASLPPNSGRRVRASSAASRSPATPDGPHPYRTYTNPPTSSGYMGRRPSSSTGRGYDGTNRGSYDHAYHSSDRLHPDMDVSRYAYRDSGGSASGPQRQSGVFSSAMPMSDSPRAQSPANGVEGGFDPTNLNVLFLAASVYEFNIDRARREAGYPYLTYVAGEIFDVIGEKGELWLAKNQDDQTNQIGWIWNKHFAKLAS